MCDKGYFFHFVKGCIILDHFVTIDFHDLFKGGLVLVQHDVALPIEGGSGFEFHFNLVDLIFFEVLVLLDAAIYIGVLGPDALIYHLNIRMQLILVREF
jgi:hypothetical protein